MHLQFCEGPIFSAQSNMDTRFWGPPAWKLLHSIAATYEPAKRGPMAEFLEILPFILPCKFCRANLTAHYKKLPYTGELDTREHLEKWLYKLHGLVNDKLREQGQTISADPSFREVQERGAALAAGPFPAWDFLFSVAHIYPPQMHEVALPDAPKSCPVGATDCERNGWNRLSKGKRMSYWMRFWKRLPGVLPESWRSAWVSAWKLAAPQFISRRAAIAGLWRVRCAFEGNKEDPYAEVCDRLTYHSSGCGAADSARYKTCRRLAERQQRSQTRKHSPQKN